MKSLLLLFIFSILPLLLQAAPDQYHDWKAHHHQVFASSAEDTVRKTIFIKNKQEIEVHNADPTKRFVMGINKFTAYTEKENQLKLCGLKENPAAPLIRQEMPILRGSNDLPSSVNWTDRGAVTSVKEQGSCGGCWAFSGAAALEASYHISKGDLMDFSYKYGLDCTDNSQGCVGGRPEYFVDYVMQKGIMGINDYAAYNGKKQKCKVPVDITMYNLKQVRRSYTYYGNITADNIKALVVQKPLMVGVYAAQAWFKYKSGVLTSCGDYDQPNHAVLLTGYDRDGNWIIKNSWGEQWGEAGYIRMDPSLTCGMESSTSYVNPDFN